MIEQSALILLLITLFCHTSLAQYPFVPCPNIFRYVRDNNNKVIGLITVNDVNYGETQVEIELSQHESINSAYRGSLNLNVDQNQIFNYIQSGSPFTYTVNFPLQNVVPHVSGIRLNGATVCSGQRVGAPSTTITLQHTLTASAPSNTYHQRNPGRRPTIPPTAANPTNPFLNNGYQYYNTQPTTTERQFYYTRSPQTSMQIMRSRPSITPRSTTTITTPPPTTSTTTTLRPTTTTTTIRTTTTTTAKPEPVLPTMQYINSVCGRENFNFTVKNLAIHGDIIPRARFPWIVALFKKDLGTLSFQCGGSLISTRTVISAAHCFYSGFDEIKEEDILVSMGRHNLTDWSDSYISHGDVKKIMRHPDYRPELINIDADLAIVLLKKSVTFSTAIRPVCMWQGPLDVRDIEGVSGIVVGWGRDESNNDVTTAPRLVTASVASEITCIRSNEQLVYLTSNRTLCAGNRDGSGPCNGDSGSGLMIRNRNKWMIRGTVSAALGSSINQCNLEEYVVYTDIAKFIGWIQVNMLL